MKKIILEDRFTTHQKLMILFCVGAPFLLMTVTVLGFNLNFKGYLFLVFLIIACVFIFCITFLKKGFIKIKSDLYRGSFF
ncbi:hypothetical protein [Mesonia sp. K7]|uniref:hypothetical protein n=1 Tax=Mesonia sp. K7 TaxID=2218606 RepID=UPI000DA94E83|nr:hypothetical protein [Mesonia sp. K7]PZD78660.1 hypothetical protein DNG35_04190 [Mesonia sp. K7]